MGGFDSCARLCGHCVECINGFRCFKCWREGNCDRLAFHPGGGGGGGE